MTKRTDDYDEIVRVIHLYLDAANENDLNKLKEALDENAWMFFIDAEGALHKGVMREMFEEGLRNGGLRKYLGDVVGRIISVTQVGDAASVQLSFDSASGKSHEWIDFHNLLRINGVWEDHEQDCHPQQQVGAHRVSADC
jgi:hypothetical protein